MGIDFGNLIRRSFEIAWQYKSMWIFGMFAGGMSSLNLDWTNKVERFDTDLSYAYDWFDRFNIPHEMMPASWGVIGAILLWVAALALLAFICYLIAQPALIDAVNKVTRGGQYAWGTSFSRGADFFWRMFGLIMVELFASLAIIAAIVVLAWALSPWTLLLTIPCAIVLFFFVFHTFQLAQVAMVARDTAIADAVIEGWSLLMVNKTNCFLMTLLMIALGIGFAIVVGVVSLILYLPVNLLVLAMTENLVAILMLALVIGLPIALVVGGYTGTFFNSLYVQFYFRLVEPTPAMRASTGAPA